MVCVTDDKDVGTIWEAGYAFARRVPILYVWLGYEPHMKFNIMLAASGKTVVHTYEDFVHQLQNYVQFNEFIPTQAVGMLHE